MSKCTLLSSPSHLVLVAQSYATNPNLFVVDTVRRLNSSLHYDYQQVVVKGSHKIKELYPSDSLDTYTLDAWSWAYSVYRSRGFKVDGSVEILPLMEVFNFAERVSNCGL
jgi:hypothetical protein